MLGTEPLASGMAYYYPLATLTDSRINGYGDDRRRSSTEQARLVRNG